MSDDLNQKIKQFADMLGQDTLPDNIKGLISLLASTAGKDGPPSSPSEAPAPKSEKPERTELNDSMEMIGKVRKVMDRLNSSNDPRVNLLTAISPFLNSKRQKKIGNCVKILQMASLVKLMEENDKGNL